MVLSKIPWYRYEPSDLPGIFTMVMVFLMGDNGSGYESNTKGIDFL